MNGSWCGAMLMCALVLPVVGGEAAKSEGGKIAALIEQLRDSDGHKRETARRELTDMGEPARALLEKAVTQAKNDPDFTAQAQLILKCLDQNYALSAFDKPATIDLETKDSTVKAIVEKLEAAFGCRIPVSAAVEAHSVSLTLKGARLFEALEALREKGNLAYRLDHDRLRGWRQGDGEPRLPIYLTAKEDENIRVSCAAGPFLLLVESVLDNQIRSIHADLPRREHRHITVEFLAIPEPALITNMMVPKAATLVDTEGRASHSLFNEDDQWRAFEREGDHFKYEDQIRVADKISGPLEWRAQLIAAVPLRMETKHLASLSAQPMHALTIPEGVVTIEEPRRQLDGKWELKITAPANSDAARLDFGWAQPKSCRPGIFVLNAAGEVMDYQGYSGKGDGISTNFSLTYTEKPEQILVRWEAEKAERKVEAVIKGIPLP